MAVGRTSGLSDVTVIVELLDVAWLKGMADGESDGIRSSPTPDNAGAVKLTGPGEPAAVSVMSSANEAPLLPDQSTSTSLAVVPVGVNVRGVGGVNQVADVMLPSTWLPAPACSWMA